MSTQPWWRPYSVAWIVTTSGQRKRSREVVAGDGDEPVVAVDEVEVEAVAQLDAGGEHVGVHVLDPGDELAEVARARAARARGGPCTPSTSSSAGIVSSPRVSTWTSTSWRDELLGRACARGAPGRPR